MRTGVREQDARPVDGGLRTVLVFAHECAPYNRKESTIGAQRPAQFAKYLPEFGWRAIVLCCDDARRGAGWVPADRNVVVAALSSADPAESVIIPTPSLPWDGWLDRSWRWVTQRPATAALAAVRKSLTLGRFFTGDYSRPWQPCARAAAAAIHALVPIDACIGEHSPDAGIFLARWFSRRYHVPWMADFRDPMLFGYPPRVRSWLAPFARYRLSTASQMIDVTPQYCAIDRATFHRPTALVTNGFDPELYISPAPQPSRERLTIVYTGNVWTPDSLSVFMRGLSVLRTLVGPERFERVRFVYRGLAAELVSMMASDAGLTTTVDVGPHVPHVEALALLRSAHLLLVLSTSEREQRDPYWAQGIYPGKTFEYMGSRRPILCVPGDGAALDALLRSTCAGVSLGSDRATATYLESMLGTWECTGTIPPSDNEDLIAPFSRRATAQQLARILDGMVAQPTIGASRPARALS